MEQLVVIGAGGHAQSVLEVLTEPGQPYEIVGMLDEQYKEIVNLLGLPLLGDISFAQKLFHDGIKNAFIALGSNSDRKALSESLELFHFPAFISKHALVAKNTSVGAGSIIMPGACLRRGVRVGKHCIVNTNACIDHEGILGDYVHVAPGCSLSGKVFLDDGVFLGTGSCVIDRIKVGKWSTVGAGGTVIKDLPANVLVVGTPVHVIRENNQ